MNKSLLRKIKQEGHNTIDYDNDVLENALLHDYSLSNIIPLNLWSYEELKTRYEELMYISCQVYLLYPDYEYDYCNNGEEWAVIDEMENIADMYDINIYGE